MCEIMATAVAGGQAAHDPEKGGVLNSMLAIVIDLAKLGDPAAIAAAAGATRAHIKSANPAHGVTEVLTPGEPERMAAAKRTVRGSRWTIRPGPISAPPPFRSASPRPSSNRPPARTPDQNFTDTEAEVNWNNPLR